MGKSKAPAPPDPNVTAAAQTGTNISTAIANAFLGNVNQNTPNGSLSYGQSGTYNWTDPTSGKTFSIPKFTATQTLTPLGQQAHSANEQAQVNLANLAKDQSARIGSLLGTPVDLSNDAVEGRLLELGRKRLDPMLAQRRDDLATQLSNQGIKLGSEAYDRAMAQDSQSANDAYNQLILGGRGQAVQEALTSRNQPINEITALLSGSQVSQPNFVPTQGGNIPTTDYAGIVNQNYNQRLGIWQQNQANKQALMGGLFGLASGGLAGGYF